MLFCSGRDGTASLLAGRPRESTSRPCFDTILDHIPAPDVDLDGPTQLLVSSDGLQRLCRPPLPSARWSAASVRKATWTWSSATTTTAHRALPAPRSSISIRSMDLDRDAGRRGDRRRYRLSVSGIGRISPSVTPSCRRSMPRSRYEFVKIIRADGRDDLLRKRQLRLPDGRANIVTSRQPPRPSLHARTSEATFPCAWRTTNTTDSFKVAGRGEMHLSILIETMRREGYEFACSARHTCLCKEIDGKKCEPIGDRRCADVPEDSVGSGHEQARHHARVSWCR